MNNYNRKENQAYGYGEHMVVARGGGWGVGHTGEGGPKVPTSSYKTSHGDVMYSIMTS